MFQNSKGQKYKKVQGHEGPCIPIKGLEPFTNVSLMLPSGTEKPSKTASRILLLCLIVLYVMVLLVDTSQPDTKIK